MENNSKKPKNFLEDISVDKPESFQAENFIPVKKGIRPWITGVGAILIICITILLFMQLSKVTIPDMSDWKVEEVQAWALKELENTVINGVYTMETTINSVISQDIKPGVKVGKSSVLTVNYSLGADPEEVIELPDIKNMKSSELKEWINEYQMSGVSLKYEESEVIDKDKVISYELVEGSSEVFLRKNRMIIYISSGNDDLGGTVKMLDFYGKSRADIQQWGKDNQVEVIIHEEFHPEIEFGKIFAQNIKKDTKITRKDKVEVSISKGKSIRIPDFTGMSRSEASELAALYGIKVFFKLELSKSKIDTVIGQNIEAGTDIDQNQILTLKIAKEEGRIMVPDFGGLTTTEANSLAELYGIKVFLRNIDEAGEQGIVDSQSIASGIKINEDQIITLLLKEKDNAIEIPNFVGMSRSEAEVLAKKLNLDVSYLEVETTKALNQTVTKQNIKAEELVGMGETILLTIAVNSGVRPENLWKMTLSDAQAWATKKGITLNVIDSYNSEYFVGKLFNQDYSTADYIPTNKILTVYYSLGWVTVENFIGKTKSEIIKWKDEVNKKGAEIELKFIPDSDTTKAKGVITNQNILEEIVDLDQVIEVHVSATNKGVVMKNFEGLTLEELKLWCDNNNVPYLIKECYSNTYEEGKLYGQNYTGAYLPKGEYLKINQSLGKLYIKDFTNQTKSAMIEWQKEINKKGANVELIFVNLYSSDIEKGKIIDQTIVDKEVELDQDIRIFVSVSEGTGY